LFKRALDLAPHNSWVHLQYGLFKWRCKHPTAAWESLQEAFALDENNFQVLRSCALFAHDRYANLMNGAQLSGRPLSPEEARQVKRLSELAFRLYKRACFMENDPSLLHSFARFCDEVLLDHKAASELHYQAERLAAGDLAPADPDTVRDV
jgi:sialic acid synthase SpsE